MEIRDFKKGDIILFCNEEFEVVENYGTSGKVKQGNEVIDNFYWTYAGERCELKKGGDKLIKFKVDFGTHNVNEEGEALVCYSRTEQFTFMCPYTENEDGSMTLNMAKTYVYLNCGKININEPLETMVVEET